MKKILSYSVALLLLIVTGFCLITSETGSYRIYYPENLPLVIKINNSTPFEYEPVIQGALDEWNNVKSSYFQFELGGRTSKSTVGKDDTNLLYFDLEGDNFPLPQYNQVIAFSTTWTSTAGGYHAVESDYIYNARDYPPSITGERNKIDLFSTTVHEIGHHLGLDHPGLPSGATSGCGVQVPEAIMWYSLSLGDTAHRHLILDDIAGVTSLYPNWVLSGTVKDSETGELLQNVELKLLGTYGSIVGPVINPIGSRTNRACEATSILTTDETGEYYSAVTDRMFTIEIDKVGYYPRRIDIEFNPSAEDGNIQYIEKNIELTKRPDAVLSGKISGTNVSSILSGAGTIKLCSDEEISENVNIDNEGNYSVNLISGYYYKLEFSFNLPYSYYWCIDSVLVPEGGKSFNFTVNPIKTFLMFTDTADVTFDRYLNSFKRTKQEFGLWRSNSSASQNILDNILQPFTLFYKANAAIPLETQELFQTHLQNGNSIVICGNDVCENETQNGAFFAQYGGISFLQNSSAVKASGFYNEPISKGLTLFVPGAGKDQLQLLSSTELNIRPLFYYGNPGASDTSAIMASIADNTETKSKFIFYGIDLDKVSTDALFDTVITRTINYANGNTEINEVINNEDILPSSIIVNQNYPNPFNPSTKISFSIPNGSTVSFVLFSITGERLATVPDKYYSAGSHTINMNFDELNKGILSSGLYLCRFKFDADGNKQYKTIKMLYLK